MPKHRLRQSVLARRRLLSGAARHDADAAAQHRVIALPEYAAARTIALYAPVHGEVATSLLMERALEAGKRVLYPAVRHGAIAFCAVRTAADFCHGTYGISEPAPYCLAEEISGADLVVVPGVAFDLHGHRIGYGKGYYDRALHHLEGTGRLAGLCYDFQLVESIAGEPHDVLMDMIITDTRVIRPRD
jgi:5-formyltetrahydrofolate cyclo-ligase